MSAVAVAMLSLFWFFYVGSMSLRRLYSHIEVLFGEGYPSRKFQANMRQRSGLSCIAAALALGCVWHLIDSLWGIGSIAVALSGLVWHTPKDYFGHYLNQDLPRTAG